MHCDTDPPRREVVTTWERGRRSGLQCGLVSGAQPPPTRRRVLRVVSACNTREAFVSAFGRYCDGQVILVATPDARGTGEELSFTITLASGLPLIIATGRVEKRFADGEGPLGRAGLFIRFVEVAPASRALLAELAAQPSEAGPVGRSGEPRQATDPSDIPELLDTRDTIPVGPSRVIVPKPPFAMTIKPDATPPPAFGDARAGTVRGEDEGPTGVKSMRAVILSRTRQPAAHGGDDFGDEASWDDGKHGSFGDAGGPGSRTALRAEPAGRLDGAELAALMA